MRKTTISPEWTAEVNRELEAHGIDPRGHLAIPPSAIGPGESFTVTPKNYADLIISAHRQGWWVPFTKSPAHSANPQSSDPTAGAFTMPKNSTPDRIMRLREVSANTGLGRTAIYQRMSEGSFPRSIPLGGRMVGWSAAEIAEWVEQRKAERDSQPSRKGQ